MICLQNSRPLGSKSILKWIKVKMDLKFIFIKDKVFEAKGFCSYFTVFNCNLTFNYYNFSDLIKST